MNSSRDLHGNYTWGRQNADQDEISRATFYNGCPGATPWRGGTIDDLSITGSLIEHDQLPVCDDDDEDDQPCLRRDLTGFRPGWNIA